LKKLIDSVNSEKTHSPLNKHRQIITLKGYIL